MTFHILVARAQRFRNGRVLPENDKGVSEGLGYVYELTDFLNIDFTGQCI